MESPRIIDNRVHCFQKRLFIHSIGYLTGGAEYSRIFLGLYKIKWWGNCNPEERGYKKIIGVMYFKPDR